MFWGKPLSYALSTEVPLQVRNVRAAGDTLYETKLLKMQGTLLMDKI